MKKIFVMTGEASGDLHAQILIRELKTLDKSLMFSGVGGDRMREESVELLYDYARFTGIGMVEPLFKLLFYKKALKKIIKYISDSKIDVVILVDFPGFNLLLAKRLRQSNITNVRIIYYISPQIWAWHYSRINSIRKNIDAIIVFYAFEEDLYKKEGVRVFFEGNPLIDKVNETLKEAEKLDSIPGRPLICLLPGSRDTEVKKHLAPMLDAALLLQERYGSGFLLPLLKGNSDNIIRGIPDDPHYNKLNIKLVNNNTYRAIEQSDFLITSSGTVTLEAAIIGKPMIVIYKVDILSELIARLVLKVDNIALVNIVAGKRICPELLQRDVNGREIFREVSGFVDDPALMNEMKREIDIVRSRLGSPGAVNRIARTVLSLVYE